MLISTLASTGKNNLVSVFFMRYIYAKPGSIIYFLNYIDQAGEEVNQSELGYEHEYYQINSPDHERQIVRLFQQDILVWGNTIFDARDRGGFHVFISLDDDIKFGIYGDDLFYKNIKFELSDILKKSMPLNLDKVSDKELSLLGGWIPLNNAALKNWLGIDKDKDILSYKGLSQMFSRERLFGNK